MRLPIRSSLAVLVLLAGIVVAVPAHSHAQAGGPGGGAPRPEAKPEPEPSPTQPDDPSFFDFPGRAKKAIAEWFAEIISSALGPVFQLLGATVFATPRIDAHPRIEQLWRFSLSLADAALVIFVLAGAGIVTVNGGMGARLTAKELIPRVLVAAAGANLSMFLLGELIAASNALSRAAFGSVDPAALGQRITEMLFEGFPNPFLLLLALVAVVLGLLVVVGFVIRVAMLVVLAASAPLLLAAHALPQSEHLARTGLRATLACLAAPVLQSLLAVLQVFLSGESLLGFSGGILIDLLVICCLLYLLFKTPFWVLNAALAGAGSRAWHKARSLASHAAKAAVAA